MRFLRATTPLRDGDAKRTRRSRHARRPKDALRHVRTPFCAEAARLEVGIAVRRGTPRGSRIANDGSDFSVFRYVDPRQRVGAVASGAIRGSRRCVARKSINHKGGGAGGDSPVSELAIYVIAQALNRAVRQQGTRVGVPKGDARPLRSDRKEVDEHKPRYASAIHRLVVRSRNPS